MLRRARNLGGGQPVAQGGLARQPDPGKLVARGVGVRQQPQFVRYFRQMVSTGQPPRRRPCTIAMRRLEVVPTTIIRTDVFPDSAELAGPKRGRPAYGPYSSAASAQLRRREMEHLAVGHAPRSFPAKPV